MKIFSLILATYIGFLSVNPVLVKSYGATGITTEEICLTSCCEEQPACEEEKSCYPEEGCTSCICGLYCICAIVNTPYDQLTSPEGLSSQNRLSNQILVSNYFSDCFRPPEVI